MNNTAWFWATLTRYAPLYGHVLVASVVVNLLGLAMPLFIMNVYDRIVPNNAFESLWVLAIGMSLAAGLDFALRCARIRFVDVAGRNADLRLQSLFLNAILNVRLGSLKEKPETSTVGALLAKVREFEYVREALGSGTILPLTDLPFIVLSLGLIFYLGGPLGFIPLLTVPILLGISIILQKSFKHRARAQTIAAAQKQSLLAEIVTGLETIRVARLTKTILKQWQQVVARSADAANEAKSLTAIHTHALTLLIMLLTVALVVAGVYRISDGAMSMGGLIAAIILFGRITGPMLNLVQTLFGLGQATMALSQLGALLELPQENFGEIVQKTTKTDTVLPLAITFEEVSFSYPANSGTALKHINLAITPGAHIGFVGPSGSGKSSLARLCAGLYLPTSGHVSWGSQDLASAPLHKIRAELGYLPQEFTLFRGTIAQNIAAAWPYEDSPLTDDDLIQAATLAGVMDFAAEHPLGLDMPLGERGSGLSGGQAQAVALARALLGNPSTIILDEPAAHLDQAAEKRLCERLAPFLAQRTVLIFTHKPQLLKLTKTVIALSNGNIIWSGPTSKALK